MNELISALERTVKLLERSEDSVWANHSVREAKEILQTEIGNYRQTQNIGSLDKSQINFLFLPTSALQEIALDNGWGDEYIEIAGVIDRYLNSYYFR
jgi:hypothetical protein